MNRYSDLIKLVILPVYSFWASRGPRCPFLQVFRVYIRWWHAIFLEGPFTCVRYLSDPFVWVPSDRCGALHWSAARCLLPSRSELSNTRLSDQLEHPLCVHRYYRSNNSAHSSIFPLSLTSLPYAVIPFLYAYFQWLYFSFSLLYSHWPNRQLSNPLHLPSLPF